MKFLQRLQGLCVNTRDLAQTLQQIILKRPKGFWPLLPQWSAIKF